MYAEELRKALRPAHLRKMVNVSVMEGLDPTTNEFDISLLETQKNPTKTMTAIRASVRALDDLIRKGVLKDEWDTGEKKLCRNFSLDRCKLGNKCPRIHQKRKAPNSNQEKKLKMC